MSTSTPTQTYDVIRTKQDLRAYSGRPVPAETERRILQAGRMAGSSKNTQPCRVIVIHEPAQRTALAACGDWATHVPAAPLVIAVVLLAEGGSFDAGRCAQNMMLAAWAEGIVSCPTSMHHQDCAKTVLGLPEDASVAIVLPMGYPEAGGRERRSHQRLAMDDFARFEHW